MHATLLTKVDHCIARFFEKVKREKLEKRKRFFTGHPYSREVTRSIYSVVVYLYACMHGHNKIINEQQLVNLLYSCAHKEDKITRHHIPFGGNICLRSFIRIRMLPSYTYG